MSLLFLEDNDFHLENGTKGKILCTNISGFSLIMFYSNQCKHCHITLSIFKQLSHILKNCRLGIVNVGTERKCLAMSRQSIVPIEYVPLILLYINGKPFMRYGGAYDINQIRNFISDATKINIQTKVTPQYKSVPAYAGGIPVSDKTVCYLKFDDAYEIKK